MYPEEQARRIARTSKELVLSSDTDDYQTEGSGATSFTMIDEQGRRQPFDTHRPPSVAAAPADREEGSGRVKLHGVDGDEAVQHHLEHIERLVNTTLSGGGETASASGSGTQSDTNQTVGTAGSTGESDKVTISRADLEQIREHARKALDELDSDQP